MPTQVFNANEARLKWRDIVDAAHAGGEDIIVERYGKPMVAVISYQDYLDIEEELDDVRAARRAAAAYEAWKQNPSVGRPWKEVEQELLDDGLLDE